MANPLVNLCNDSLIDRKSAAKALGVSVSWLDADRANAEVRIPFFKIGGRILYRRADVLAFLESCRQGGKQE